MVTEYFRREGRSPECLNLPKAWPTAYSQAYFAIAKMKLACAEDILAAERATELCLKGSFPTWYGFEAAALPEVFVF